jgi:hypothetical protein
MCSKAVLGIMMIVDSKRNIIVESARNSDVFVFEFLFQKRVACYFCDFRLQHYQVVHKFVEKFNFTLLKFNCV